VQPWITQNTYYVDVNRSDDSGAGTSWSVAKKTIAAAITAGNTAAIPYVIYVRAGTYVRFNGFGSAVPSQPCAFIAVGGRVNAGVFDALTWTLDSGTTYSASRSLSQRVYDTKTKDVNGDYTEFPKANPYTLTGCRAQAGSWFTDGTTVYVNRGDAIAVTDSNTRVYLSAVNGAKSTTSGNMYLSGFDFEGGNQGCIMIGGNPTGLVVLESSSFKYVADTGDYSSVAIKDVAACALINCVASQPSADCYNAHAFGGIKPFMLTINCIGRNAGKIGNNSNNGLTTHDGCSALDINGLYFGNRGGNIAIVNADTQLWCVGTRAESSLGDSFNGGPNPSCDFQTDQSTPSLWLDGCVSVGSTVSILKTSGTVNVRGGYMSNGIGSASTY